MAHEVSDDADRVKELDMENGLPVEKHPDDCDCEACED